MARNEDWYYELPDPQLRSFDHGVGTLSVAGEVKGHLACVVGRMLGGAVWPWFVIVWTDGTREEKFEDYGPSWPVVRELDAGTFEHRALVQEERRFLGIRYLFTTGDELCRYDFAWLAEDEAAIRWQELGLTDADF